MRSIFWAAAVFGVMAAPAVAYDDSAHLTRVLDCISPGDDVRMELYLPGSVVFGEAKMDNPKKPVTGYYALDLEKLGKGKPLEPVKVWMDEKAKVLIVDQYTRGHPPTRVPLDGGVVNFDDRFAQRARCKPYNFTREDESAVPYPPAADVQQKD